MKFYHGASYEAGANILKNGFSDEKDCIWSCSDPEMVYLAGESDEDVSDWKDYCMSDSQMMAFEASQIAAAFFGSTETKTIVFEFDVPEEFLGLFDDDDSCGNMIDSYQINALTLNDLVNTGKIKCQMHIFEGAYNREFRVFYLPYNQKMLNELEDYTLRDAAKMVNENNIFIDYIIGCYESVQTIDVVNFNGIAAALVAA